jgi:hypothetical protein
VIESPGALRDQVRALAGRLARYAGPDLPN